MNKKDTEKKDFYLIETLVWQPQMSDSRGNEGFPLLEMHLDRLEKSARFFGFSYPEDLIMHMLNELSAKLGSKHGRQRKKFKIRCTLGSSGRFAITDVDELHEIKSPVLVDISSRRVDPQDIFLYHKTSRRKLFNLERTRIEKIGLFDTMLLNNRGEITQGTITNIFVDIGADKMLTPAVECGLLPGILREKMLKEGRAEEAVLHPVDIHDARAVYVGNSVRGLMEIRLTGL